MLKLPLGGKFWTRTVTPVLHQDAINPSDPAVFLCGYPLIRVIFRFFTYIYKHITRELYTI